MQKIIILFLLLLSQITFSKIDISKEWELIRGNDSKKKISLPFIIKDQKNKVTFRKSVVIEEHLEDQVIILGKIDDEDTVYFNGYKIGETNIKRLDKYNYISFFAIERIYQIPKEFVKNGENEIVVEIRNYFDRFGISGNDFLIMTEKEFFNSYLFKLKKRIKISYGIYLILIGLFIGTGIKYIIEYYLYKSTREDLYSSGLIIVFALYLFLKIPQRDYFGIFTSYETAKLDYILIIVLASLANLLSRKFFSLKKFLLFKILLAINGVFILLILGTLDITKAQNLFVIWNPILLLQLMIYTLLIFKAKMNFDNRIISFGMFFWLLTTIYDDLYHFSVVDFFGTYTNMYGCFMFTLSLIVVKSRKYYSVKIKESKANIELEKKVRDKTKEIEEYASRLEESNIQLKQTIDELRAKENQLIRSERLAVLGEFAGEITHEIKNPLGAILANIQLLKKDIKDLLEKDEMSESTELLYEMSESTEITEEAAKQARSVIANILNYTKLDDSSFKEVSLKHIIASSTTILKKEIEKLGIRLEVNLSENVIIKARSGEITQVILNLILNSRDAIIEKNPPEKLITIQAKKEGEKVILSVEDNGVGMTDDEKAKIFEPFFTTKKEGNGLGMSVSASILERHKVQTNIESEKGIGTKITLSFDSVEKKPLYMV